MAAVIAAEKPAWLAAAYGVRQHEALKGEDDFKREIEKLIKVLKDKRPNVNK